MNTLEKFAALGISPTTLSALRTKGFEEPTTIQALAIPKLLSGAVDVVGQAQTGTGKTAAFGIPIIDLLRRGKHVQALILSPTRELAIQIAEEMNSFKGESDLRIAPFYGGQAIEIQLRRLREGADVVVGTPGRIMDLLTRGKLALDHLQFAVLDEADEMLNMGFVEDIKKILAATNPDKRMLMFSATMPPEILKIAETFMREYEIVRTVTPELGGGRTEQIYFEVRRDDKLEALSRIIDMENDIYALVFCRTRNDVNTLTEKLKLRGQAAEALHGDIPQAQRTQVINRFRARKFKILIATDVAARGIDVNDLTHVINYSLPEAAETYVHRIGRTGRAGKTGTAITFITPAEFRKLTAIQREAGTDIRRRRLPQGAEVAGRKKERFTAAVREVLTAGGQEGYRDFARELIAAAASPEDALAAALRLQFNDELLAENYADIGGRRPPRDGSDRDFADNRDSRENRIARREKRRLAENGQTRLFVGCGREGGYGPGQLLQMLEEKAGVDKARVGKIDCFDRFSFINVAFEDAENIIRSFRRNGPPVQVAAERGERPAPKNGRPERPPRRPRRPRPPAEFSENDAPRFDFSDDGWLEGEPHHYGALPGKKAKKRRSGDVAPPPAEKHKKGKK